MTNGDLYDVAIVGGGLAGLACAIQLGGKGYHVILFEKEVYPFHKVCGEYISLESYDYLISLGLPLQQMKLPIVKTLSLSSPNGTLLTQDLPLGGFGISRYAIDDALAKIARGLNVKVADGIRVQDIHFTNEKFNIITDMVSVEAAVCCAASGKRSNLDVKWKRAFVQQKPNALNNFIAVKYHAILDHPRNNIALHNFQDGYCGIEPIENDRTCICYLTTAQNLRNNTNSIQLMEQEVLFKNPFLKDAFAKADMLYEKPLTISQISFEKKEQVQEHVLLLGDAAGLITPLCGNGMSMALQSSRIAAALISSFLEKKISRPAMEAQYIKEWKETFGKRLMAGRMIQSLFGKKWMTNAVVEVLRHFPSLVTRIIRQTHG